MLKVLLPFSFKKYSVVSNIGLLLYKNLAVNRPNRSGTLTFKAKMVGLSWYYPSADPL